MPDRQSREYRVESSRKKYFASRLGRNSFIDSVVPFPQEGRLAIVTDVGYGMRWTRQRQARRSDGARTNDADVDGEVVWSWRPDAGAKLAEAIPRVTVAKEPGHRGDHEGNR